ncbi:MAG: hypothetical protein WCD42_08585 [Rhizomicrobium sp.]
MAQKTVIAAFVAAALIAPAALAQAAPPPAGPNTGPGPFAGKAFSKEDMQKHHAQMCSGFYAHEVGALAELEVRLQLTAKQKPLFEKWKTVKLSAAKAHSETCLSMKGPDLPPPDAGKGAKPPVPSPVEGLKHEMQGLQDKLTEIKAELPALEALAASLSDDQKLALEPHHGPRGPMGGPQGPHDGPHDGGHDGPHGGSEMGPQPPAPTDH